MYSVSTYPGQITLQVTPDDACERAIDRASTGKPPFAAVYAGASREGRRSSPADAPKNIIRPNCSEIMYGRQRSAIIPGSARFIVTIRSQVLVVWSEPSGSQATGPYATTRIWTSVYAVNTVRSDSDSNDARIPVGGRRPSLEIRESRRSSFCRSCPAWTNTSAPASHRTEATAAPIPPDPPITRARRPARSTVFTMQTVPMSKRSVKRSAPLAQAAPVCDMRRQTDIL